MTHRLNNFPPASDSTAKQAPMAPGLQIRFSCLGCGKSRNPSGSRGAGIKRRCAQCVASAEAKKGGAA